MQSDVANALNISAANVQLQDMGFIPPDIFSTNVSATVPLPDSLARSLKTPSSASGSSLSLKVGASYDLMTPAEASAAAQDLNADVIIQALVDNPDAFPQTSQATGGQVQVSWA